MFLFKKRKNKEGHHKNYHLQISLLLGN